MTKRKSGIYEYLKAKGLLGSSDTTAIENAKKQYWKEYRRKYKQARLSGGKEYKVYFDNKTVARIQNNAEEKEIPETTYIRYAVLQALKKQTPQTPTLNRITHLLRLSLHKHGNTDTYKELYEDIVNLLFTPKTMGAWIKEWIKRDEKALSELKKILDYGNQRIDKKG